MVMILDRVVIQMVPHDSQRYPTVGDWMFLDNILYLSISDMGDDKYHQLVAVHEYVEAILCRESGVTDTEVTAFDKEYENWRLEGKVGEFDEPGNDPRAPYYKQHQAATEVEKKLAEVLGVDWNAYDMAVNTL